MSWFEGWLNKQQKSHYNKDPSDCKVTSSNHWNYYWNPWRLSPIQIKQPNYWVDNRISKHEWRWEKYCMNWWIDSEGWTALKEILSNSVYFVVPLATFVSFFPIILIFNYDHVIIAISHWNQSLDVHIELKKNRKQVKQKANEWVEVEK